MIKRLTLVMVLSMAVVALCSDFVVVGNKLVRNGSKGVIVPWTPEKIVSGWWDMSDISTITESVPGRVVQLDDKSGNGYFAFHVNLANQPETGVETVNGLNVFTFNGVEWMGINAVNWTNYTRFFVGHVNTVMSGNQNFFSDWGVGGQHALYSPVVSATLTLFGSGNRVSSGTIGVGQNIIGCATYTPGTGSLYLNGNHEGTASYTATTVSQLSIGNYLASANRLVGAMGEVIIVNSVLSTADRQRVEGYLAWKWGLVASLPIGHPYKEIRP